MYNVYKDFGEGTISVFDPYDNSEDAVKVGVQSTGGWYYAHLADDGENMVILLHNEDQEPRKLKVNSFKKEAIIPENVNSYFVSFSTKTRDAILSDIDRLYEGKTQREKDELDKESILDTPNGISVHLYKSSETTIYRSGGSLLAIVGNLPLSKAAKMVEVGVGRETIKPKQPYRKDRARMLRDE